MTSAFGSHPDQESMIFLSLSYVGMESSFHFLDSDFYLLKEYVNKPDFICQACKKDFLHFIYEIDSAFIIDYNNRVNSFKIGDKVIYPNQGLGIIEDIQEASYDGQNCKVYHLRLLSNNALVLIPSSNAEELGVRRPTPEKQIKKIFDFIKSADVDVTMNWKGRYKEHLNLMKSGLMLDMVLVLKSLFLLNLIKPLSFREKKMMEKVKELIVSEISEASSLPVSKIEEKVMDALSICFEDVDPRIDS